MLVISGDHLEDCETIEAGLKRKLKEEISFEEKFTPSIINYYDEIKEKNGEAIYYLEIDIIIELNSLLSDIKLSDEHSRYEWVIKNTNYLDDYIRDKIKNE